MKIWSKLFLVAATGMMMFSSCLENIEPEGIADLRGAKAELLRAETALTEAKAAKENAEAALTQAKAKVEEAKAKQEEALAKKMEAEARIKELEAAKQEALDAIEIEQAIAEAEALKAQAELEAQIAAAELEAELVEAQTLVLTAKAEYEKALKNLELAKKGLTAEQIAYLQPYQDKVDSAQETVDAKSDSLSAAAINLKAAIANLDENKASAVVLRHYEKAIIQAEAKLKGLEEVVAMFEAAMELDPKYTDWAEKIDELKAERDAKNLAFAEGATERRERKTELTAVKDTLKAAYEEYEDATGFAFDAVTGEFSDAPGTKNELPYPNINIPSPKDEEGDDLFPGKNDINWKGYEYYTDPTTQEVSKVAASSEPNFYYKDTEGGLLETTVVEAFDEAIEAYAAINGESEEANIANRKALIKGQEEDPANVALKETYEARVAAYKAGDPTQYFKAVAEEAGNEYDIEKAVADYNAALEAMVKAMDAVNAEYKRVYDAADANEKALLEADAAMKTAVAIADGVYYSKLQTALNTYKAAEKTFETAFFTYQRATNTYNAAMAEAVAAVNALEAPYGLGATPADVADKINAALTANASNTDEAYTKAGGPKSVYTTQQAKVKAAQEAYDDAVKTDDATDVWKKAQEAFAKAGGPANCVPTYTPGDPLDYNKVYYKTNAAGQYKKDVEAAYNAWDAAKTAAQTEYDLKEAELANSGVELDTQYMYALGSNFTNAKTALTDAIGTTIAIPPVKSVKDYAFIKSEDVAVEMGVEDDTEHPGYVQFTGNFPDYLVDEETKALKAIKVADIIDKEYFLARWVKPVADQLYAVMTVSNVDYENKEIGIIVNDGSYLVVIGAPADYPLSVPTYEEYVKAIEAFEGDNAAEKAEAYAKEAWRVFANACVASGGSASTNEGGITDYTYSGTETALVFRYKDEIAASEVAIANVDKAAEHVKVLEAAKAEFEAWAAKEEARIDALRPRVEAEWMDVTAELDEIDNAQTAHDAEVQPITDAISDLDSLVTNYVKIMAPEWNVTTEEYDIKEQSPTAGDLEAFVAGLQDAYNDAVLAVGDCEAELEDAKTNLEKAKAGDWSYNSESSSAQVTAVKIAQAAYDKAAAELEYALSRLAEATEALKAAMEAIGAVEPEAEETPAE